MDDLLRSKNTARVPPHAISNDGERHPPTPGMGDKRHPVLLFLAIPLMLGNAGIYRYWHRIPGATFPEAGSVSRT